MHFERATEFLYRHARLLERRLFERHFRDGSPDAVVAALRPYQNADSGFGQALEPDLRTPESQPICAELALTALCEAGAHADDVIQGVCGYLETVADANGAVAPARPGANDHPCADHWSITEWALKPAVNPTAGIAGRLLRLGASHPWLDRATEWCLVRIAEETFASAHTLRSALTLAERCDQELVERIVWQLDDAEWFTREVPVTQYTLTPLHFAPTPDAPARALFADALIEAHLDDLAARQQEDGGWPIHWKAPGSTAVSEWRGRWTLDALVTLRAYGRI